MTALILKWLFIAAAYLGPFIFVFIFRRFWRNDTGTSILVKLIYWPFMWISGLIYLQASLTQHQSHWIDVHGGLPRTEDDMMAFGDGPNVSALWVVTGLLPLIVAYIIVRYVSRRKNNVAEQVAASDR